MGILISYGYLQFDEEEWVYFTNNTWGNYICYPILVVYNCRSGDQILHSICQYLTRNKHVIPVGPIFEHIKKHTILRVVFG